MYIYISELDLNLVGGFGGGGVGSPMMPAEVAGRGVGGGEAAVVQAGRRGDHDLRARRRRLREVGRVRLQGVVVHVDRQVTAHTQFVSEQ